MTLLGLATPAQIAAFRLTGPKFVTVQGAAQHLAAAAYAAFWLEGHGHDVSFHRAKIEREVRELAALVGLRIAPEPAALPAPERAA